MAEGQELGTRSYYGYTNDAGTVYSLLLDDTLAAAAGLAANDAGVSPPRRWKPRVVFVQSAAGNRKELVVNAGSALFNTDTSASVTIDGTVFNSTGRRGEKLSFPNNPAPPPP